MKTQTSLPKSTSSPKHSSQLESSKQTQRIGIIYESIVLILLFGTHSLRWILSGDPQNTISTQGAIILINFYIFAASFILHLALGFFKNQKRTFTFRTAIRILVWVCLVVNTIENQLVSSTARENPQFQSLFLYSYVGAFIFFVIQQLSMQGERIRRLLICATIMYLSVRIAITLEDAVLGIFGCILVLVYLAFLLTMKRAKKKKAQQQPVEEKKSQGIEGSILKVLLQDIDEGFIVLQDNRSIYYSNPKLREILDCTQDGIVNSMEQIRNFTTLSGEAQMNIKNKILEENNNNNNGGVSEKDLDDRLVEKGLIPLFKQSNTKSRPDIDSKGNFLNIPLPKDDYSTTTLHPLMTTEKSPMASPVNFAKGKGSLQSLSFGKQPSRNFDTQTKMKKKSFPFLSLLTADDNAKQETRPDLTPTPKEKVEKVIQHEDYLFRDGLFQFYATLKGTIPSDQLQNLTESNEYSAEQIGYITGTGMSTGIKLVGLKIQPFFLEEKFLLVIRLKDITEKEHFQMIRHSDKDKATMLSSVSHELRTPLNCIITMLEIIEDNVNEEVRDSYLLPAAHSAKLLLSLVNDILDFTQSKAKTLKLIYSHFNLKQHLEDVIKLMQLQAKAKGLELNFIYDEKAPIKVYSEPNRLRQIIINLLGNALKFTVKGSITLKAAYTDQNTFRISVIDTGIGIKPENIRELFRQFSRVMDNMNFNHQGAGLGLAISNMLAKELSPNRRGINVDSIYGYGSTFSFEIESKVDMALKQTDGEILSLDDDEPSKLVAKNMNIMKHKAQEAHVQMTKLFQKEKFSPYIMKTGYSRVSSFIRTITVEKEELSISSIQYSDKSPHKKKSTSFTQYAQLIGLGVSKSNSSMLNPRGSYTPKTLEHIDEIVFAEDKPFVKSRLCYEGDEHTGKSNRSQMQRVVFETDQSNLDTQEANFLIVDDNTFNILPLARLLENMGHKADSATNGDLAIQKIMQRKQKPYKIVFMDCHMPIKDGYETTQEIRALESQNVIPKIPIVAVTASNYPSDVKKCYEAGMDDFITKPVNVELLKEIVKKFMK